MSWYQHKYNPVNIYRATLSEYLDLKDYDEKTGSLVAQYYDLVFTTDTHDILLGKHFFT